MHQQNPMRALVVEDEFMIRLDLEQLLAGFGFPVDGFADPRSAEAALDGSTYAVALLDLGFAGGADTLALAIALRRRGIPLIFCSGSRVRPAGFEDVPFVEKPYFDEQLRRVIEVALSENLQAAE